MKFILKIKRYDPIQSKSYFQTFTVDEPPDSSVTSVLTRLNQRTSLTDMEGQPARPVDWECSCMQKMCGACAMVINGIPRLACATFVQELCRKEQENPVIRLEPLSKFPVIKDLRVDRSQLLEDLKQMKIWLNAEAVVDKKELEHQYQSATCLLCGCCLEVCPNYSLENDFVGAAVMNSAYRIATQFPKGSNRRLFIKENVKRGQGHCSKALSCEKVCPVNIPVGALASKMNHLYIKGLFIK